MTPAGERETLTGENLTRLFLQVGLPLYLRDILKTTVDASKNLEVELAMAGHLNAFPSVPKVTTVEWDLLQTFDYSTLLRTQVFKGNAVVWQGAVADITVEVSHVSGLLKNLASVKRTVAPTTLATVLLSQPADAIARLHANAIAGLHQTGACRESWYQQCRACRAYARCSQGLFKVLINGKLQNPSPSGTKWTLDEELGCYKSFYVLEALPQRWSDKSPVQLLQFKCNCQECIKCASCVHVLLAGMVCDPSILVPFSKQELRCNFATSSCAGKAFYSRVRGR